MFIMDDMFRDSVELNADDRFIMLQIHCTSPMNFPVRITLSRRKDTEQGWAKCATLGISSSPYPLSWPRRVTAEPSHEAPTLACAWRGNTEIALQTYCIPLRPPPFCVVWIGYAMITGIDRGCHLFGVGTRYMNTGYLMEVRGQIHLPETILQRTHSPAPSG
jgi:hypothetical protein